LDSAVKQTLKDIEIIVVNDASPSNTSKILAEYLNDKRVKIITHMQNQGLGKTRDTGIAHAHGEYLAFLDADDWLELDMCEKTYQKAQEFDADMVCFNLKWVNNTGEILKYVIECDQQVVASKNEFLLSYFIPRNKIPTPYFSECNKIVKRSIYLAHSMVHIPDIYAEDVIFSLKLLYYCDKIVFIPNAYYNYLTDNQNSITQSVNPKWPLDMMRSSVESYSFLKSQNALPPSLKHDIIIHLYHHSRYYLLLFSWRFSMADYKEFLQRAISLIEKIDLNEFLEFCKYEKKDYFIWNLLSAKLDNARMRLRIAIIMCRGYYWGRRVLYNHLALALYRWIRKIFCRKSIALKGHL
jgi:glycosyltransferase involved in cell wall biosynthesis